MPRNAWTTAHPLSPRAQSTNICTLDSSTCPAESCLRVTLQCSNLYDSAAAAAELAPPTRVHLASSISDARGLTTNGSHAQAPPPRAVAADLIRLPHDNNASCGDLDGLCLFWDLFSTDDAPTCPTDTLVTDFSDQDFFRSSGPSPSDSIHQDACMASAGPSPTTALHTGWPLWAVTSSTDALTARCIAIYDQVRATGVPNFLQARVPLPHQLRIPQWRYYLQGHSNISLVDFLEYGFPVGFNPAYPLESTNRNHGSSLQYPGHVLSYLTKEVECQAMLGPFPHPPFWPWSHINPLMTRPKRNSTDRRVILDLSWPLHASVNGGTQLEEYLGESYKLLLPTVDDFAQILVILAGVHICGG